MGKLNTSKVIEGDLSHGDESLKSQQDYEQAIEQLNTLQSNASALKQANQQANALENTVSCLERCGMSLNDLDALSVIHVAGTKGKGSTCAITESILRCHGARTGFFSSPHLVSVTERIRINGEPIAKEKFARYFWRVYNRMVEATTEASQMPAYFKFLTLLSFHIFLEEQVDVVILEVGIGGELDSTNIVRNTKTVGITSLGLEHTQILGDTLEQIAWQKAGIIKAGAHVYTNVKQPECVAVIRQRAREKNAPLYRVPDFSEYSSEPDMWQQFNEVIQLNAPLGIQLANDWLRRQRPDVASADLNTPLMNETVLTGLRNCRWPGRCQIIRLGSLDIHLDGAHTVESMLVCRNWFQRATSEANNNPRSYPKVLIFNTTGDRDAAKLLKILRSGCEFAMVCFVPNFACDSSIKKDNITVHSLQDQLQRARLHAATWKTLSQADPAGEDTSQVFSSVANAFVGIQSRFLTEAPTAERVDVLVTGSIHLLGATMLALDELKARGYPPR